MSKENIREKVTEMLTPVGLGDKLYIEEVVATIGESATPNQIIETVQRWLYSQHKVRQSFARHGAERCWATHEPMSEPFDFDVRLQVESLITHGLMKSSK